MVKKVLRKIKMLYSGYAEIQYRNSVPISHSVNAVKHNRVNLQYCNEKNNIGDLLSPVVYEYMMSRKGISPDQEITCTKNVYAIGSIIDFGFHDATIWGSGMLNEQALYRMVKSCKLGRILDIRAVRGPFTRDILLKSGYECPEVYGDPAIIMPLIYTPQVTKIKDISCIVHLNGEIDAKVQQFQGDFIDLKTTDYKQFIDQLCMSKKVISSSLHGIILAETYGVPAVLLLEDVKDQVMKFYDWYHATGRQDFSVASSLKQALNMEPTKLPELAELREKLISVFPYDLFDACNLPRLK